MSTILQCDKCSKVHAMRFTIPVESYTDGAGSRAIILDLCDECVREWFKKLLHLIEMKGKQTRDSVEEFTGRAPEVV